MTKSRSPMRTKSPMNGYDKNSFVDYTYKKIIPSPIFKKKKG